MLFDPGKARLDGIEPAAGKLIVLMHGGQNLRMALLRPRNLCYGIGDFAEKSGKSMLLGAKFWDLRRLFAHLRAFGASFRQFGENARLLLGKESKVNVLGNLRHQPILPF